MLLFRKYKFWFPLVILFIGILFTSCNPTKYVPDDRYLLNRVNVVVDKKSINKDELKSYIRQKANKRILGARFHLGLYDLSNINKKTGINKYLRKIGEEPEIWDQYATNRSLKQLRLYLLKKGYFDSEVYDSLLFKKRKVNVTYYVKSNKPYIFRNLRYDISDTALNSLVMSDTINSLIKRNKIYDEDVLTNEIVRLEYLIRDRGYYSFSRDYMNYLADSSLNHKVDLTLVIRSNELKLDNGIKIKLPFRQKKISNVTVITESEQDLPVSDSLNKIRQDTFVFNGIKFVYHKNSWVKPNVILQQNYITPGSLYRISNVEETKRHLSSLNVFGLVGLQFNELPGNDTARYKELDCKIRLSPLNIQSYSIEAEGTNSSGNLGGALNLVYQHKSLFGNAEILGVKLRGALESVRLRDSTLKNTVEYGIETTISTPKFLLPINSIKFIKKYNPKTNISFSYNYKERPGFTHKVANVSFGYIWKQGKYVTHVINPIDLNYVKLLNPDSTFIAPIKNNPYLRYSYSNHLVSVTSYSWIYNNQNIKKTTDFKYIRLNVEPAGNLLSLINSLAGVKKTDNYYTLFGNRFSQYFKTDLDYRYYHIVTPTSKMAYRFYSGVAIPYGNDIAIPFEKQYFSGGPNSIRGWQVASLGPGSYRDTTTGKYKYNTGDIKLEANIEFRFKLFWIVEGALFTDVGNIWSISKSDLRNGVLFKWNKFYKDLAVGSGLGLRFNFSFFIFRTDLGVKMRNPANDIGKRWIFSGGSPTTKDLALNIAIAYPF